MSSLVCHPIQLALSSCRLNLWVSDEDTSKIPDVSIVEASAELLYGLVHQRYILTRAGLQAMVRSTEDAFLRFTKWLSLQVDKYEAGVFGSCPRVYCNGCNVVPCGRSDLPGLDTVKLFCPNCNDLYSPPSSRFQGVDGKPACISDLAHALRAHAALSRPGAFFGTTFAHLFFQSYRELAPAPFWRPPSPLSSTSSASSSSPQTPFVNPNPNGGQKPAAGRVYVAKIYGFRVNDRAKNGPRMQWLRLRPESPEELDMVDWRGRWLDDEDDEFEDDEEGFEDRPMEDFDPVRHSYAR